MTNETQQVEISAGHTPGPWYADIAGFNPHCGATINANGRPRIASVYWERTDGAEIADGGYIAHPANAETVANARLIAAAPDLLEALEGLFRECVMIHRFGGDADNTRAAREAEEAARAAIRKARGEGGASEP